MKKIVLDTNAYVGLLKGDEKILQILTIAKIVYLPVIVIGELQAGFNGGNQKHANKAVLEKFLSKKTVSIANVTQETAEIFGFVKNNLKIAGTPLPINDIWIAAQTIELGAIIVTYDAHFNKIAGLRIWE
ncbi:MAG: type II toxin-antitoxin system VapC family toxin [Methylococcales bacterium]|nr:type II toxin-antitoxin system VapC family toxin [Methylococcales bacterium]